MEGSQLHTPAALLPGKGPSVFIGRGSWVGHRAGLDAEAKRRIARPCLESNPGRPARNQPPYCFEARSSSNIVSKKTQHFPITKISWLTLLKEIIDVYFETPWKHINTLCGQNAEIQTGDAGGTYSYHWALNC
jgi:hypothetical protein